MGTCLPFWSQVLSGTSLVRVVLHWICCLWFRCIGISLALSPLITFSWYPSVFVATDHFCFVLIWLLQHWSGFFAALLFCTLSWFPWSFTGFVGTSVVFIVPVYLSRRWSGMLRTCLSFSALVQFLTLVSLSRHWFGVLGTSLPFTALVFPYLSGFLGNCPFSHCMSECQGTSSVYLLLVCLFPVWPFPFILVCLSWHWLLVFTVFLRCLETCLVFLAFSVLACLSGNWHGFLLVRWLGTCRPFSALASFHWHFVYLPCTALV